MTISPSSAAAPRLPQGLRGLQGGDGVEGCPDGDPGQDRQGLDPRGRGRGTQHHHQAKKLSEAELKIFRDRIQLPIPDSKIKDAPY